MTERTEIPTVQPIKYYSKICRLHHVEWVSVGMHGRLFYFTEIRTWTSRLSSYHYRRHHRPCYTRWTRIFVRGWVFSHLNLCSRPVRSSGPACRRRWDHINAFIYANQRCILYISSTVKYRNISSINPSVDFRLFSYSIRTSDVLCRPRNPSNLWVKVRNI